MDLYNIPGDTGGNWRLNKFVEYQHEVPSIHYRVLGEYIKKYVKDKDEAVYLCWYMSCTYNEITCMLLHEMIHTQEITKKTCKSYFDRFWRKHKETLDFGSSRKYAKNMDWFPELMVQFMNLTKNKPYKWLKSFSEGEKGYKDLFKCLENMKFVGRFAAELFMESVLYLNEFFNTSFIEPSKLDWKRCSNLTSGLLNIFYLDEEANLFDKTGKLPVDEEFLTEKIEEVKKEIYKVYPEQRGDGINLFVGKICSFRNLFKNSRYGGFHHDRELGVLKAYEKTLPEYQYVWDRAYKLRSEMFDDRFLGEIGGWNGIRKERKKLFLTKGLTGVETEKQTKLLVNIRGCNGSGKSTIPMSMMDDPEVKIVSKPFGNKSVKILTVFPTYKWVALGSYLNKTGGMDTLSNKALKQKILWYALKKYPEYDILMEGVIDSTVRGSYIDLFNEVKQRYPDRTVIVASFVPPVDVCLDRVYERNRGKPIKEDAVIQKHKIVDRNVDKFKEAGFISLRLDTSKVKREDMLKRFLKTVEKYRKEF